MKISANIPFCRRVKAAAAFTLAEMMVAVAIFSLVVAATVAVQLFGMRIYTLAATKISATSDARHVLNAMCNNIRAAKQTYVGTYNPTTSGPFVQVPDGSPQMGNALALLFTNAASSNYLIYYQDSTQPTNLLCMVTNGVTTVLAKYMTNYYCFQAEDYQGNVVTNYNNHVVIHVIMQFYEWEYPIAYVATNNALNAYGWYRLETRISRRDND